MLGVFGVNESKCLLEGFGVPENEYPDGGDAPVDGAGRGEVCDLELGFDLGEDFALLGVLLPVGAHLLADRQVALGAQVGAVAWNHV